MKNVLGVSTGLAATAGAISLVPGVAETAGRVAGTVRDILEPVLPYAGVAAPFALPLVGGKIAYDVANKFEMNKLAKGSMMIGGAAGGLALASATATTLAPYLVTGAGVYYGYRGLKGAYNKFKGGSSS